MSAIGGLLRFDGQPVARRDLERMANALRPHGPDRSDVLVNDTIGFVHVLMRMTPEDLFERQPMRGAGGALFAADLRLDNRDDILGRLGVPVQQAASWPDSRVAFSAWEKFGDDVWTLLHGPFGIAVWDPRKHTLTLARDHLGLSPLMYYRTKDFFAFATMPKGMFALPDVPRELNEEKMADFLVLNHFGMRTTFYRDVFRVLPAHRMTVSAQGASAEHRYWSVKNVPQIRMKTNQDYADGLRECLDRSVRQQMRSAHPIAAMLSGGLDSSSVAALAARALGEKGQRLAAFTHVPREGFDGPVPRGRYADEKPYVEEIRKLAGNIDVTYVPNDKVDDFADLERMFLLMEAPVRNPSNMGWVLEIPKLARAQGCRVLLGGQWGNYTISWGGWSQAAKHMLSGRLITAYRQWMLYYENSSDSPGTVFRKLFVEPLVPDRIAKWAWERRRGKGPAYLAHAPVMPDYIKAIGVETRANADGHDFRYRMMYDERIKLLTPVDYFGEWQAGTQALSGVETRDPTADIDVVTYCFGVPPEQYLAEDIDRSLIRRAMWGLLPEVVLTNSEMGLQSPDWYEKLAARRDTMLGEIEELRGSPLASKAIDLDRLKRAIENWPKDGWQRLDVIEEYHLALTRGIGGARFLRWHETANRAGSNS
jgi:asparagine synthase (glutamine-hydrolysing)